MSTEDARSGTTFCPQVNRKFVLAAAILASAMGFIDGSVVSIAMPSLRDDLGATFAQSQWVSNAYMLALASLLLVGGAVGDVYGLRRVFVFGISLFVIASGICALAPDAITLVAARALQGVGAAVMIPSSLAIIAKSYPKEERGRAIGIWAASASLTTAFGPALGGALLSLFGSSAWRLIFAINLPLGVGALLLLIYKVPQDPRGRQRSLDLIGAALATTALLLLTTGLTVGEGAPTGLTVIALCAGGLLVCAFLMWERRKAEPMVDLCLFNDRAFAGANAATFFLYGALSAVLFFLPMLLVSTWDVTEAKIGILFLPGSFVMSAFSPSAGRLADRIGPKLPIVMGSVLAGAAFAGLAWLSALHIHAFWEGVLPLMLLWSTGMTLVVSPLSAAVMTAVEDWDTGAASGVNNAVSRVAGLLAIAGLGTLLSTVHTAGLPAAGLPDFGATAPVDPVFRDVWLNASDRAFALIAFLSAGLCLVAAIIAWLTLPSRRATRRDSEAATN